MRALARIILLFLAPLAAGAGELHVGAAQSFKTMQAAISAAVSGDTIFVHAGVYREGRVVVDKPLTLAGLDRPRLDGGGTAELIVVTAPGVTIRGFELVNGGASSLTDIAAIRVSDAADARVENNRIVNCSFGIYLSRAPGAVIVGNEIRGDPGRAHGDGNGIHAWSCERLEIAGNRISGHRDGIYIEFTTDTLVARNEAADNLRYGLHFMSAHRNTYRDNTFLRNGAGVAVMYSREVRMEGNRFGRSWGSAAYGLLLRDLSDGRIVGNTFESNSTGVTMQNSSRMAFEGNVFLGNGWALQVQSSCSDNTFLGNDFSGNAFDLATNGRLESNRFDGNYWDKAELYDLNRDGVGDVPYRPLSLFAMLVERMPSSLLLLRSPLAHFLDSAERVFPSLTPDGLLDAHPAMRPRVAAGGPSSRNLPSKNPTALASAP